MLVYLLPLVSTLPHLLQSRQRQQQLFLPTLGIRSIWNLLVELRSTHPPAGIPTWTPHAPCRPRLIQLELTLQRVVFLFLSSIKVAQIPTLLIEQHPWKRNSSFIQKVHYGKKLQVSHHLHRRGIEKISCRKSNASASSMIVHRARQQWHRRSKVSTEWITDMNRAVIWSPVPSNSSTTTFDQDIRITTRSTPTSIGWIPTSLRMVPIRIWTSWTVRMTQFPLLIVPRVDSIRWIIIPSKE